MIALLFSPSRNCRQIICRQIILTYSPAYTHSAIATDPAWLNARVCTICDFCLHVDRTLVILCFSPRAVAFALHWNAALSFYSLTIEISIYKWMKNWFAQHTGCVHDSCCITAITDEGKVIALLQQIPCIDLPAMKGSSSMNAQRQGLRLIGRRTDVFRLPMAHLTAVERVSSNTGICLRKKWHSMQTSGVIQGFYVGGESLRVVPS